MFWKTVKFFLGNKTLKPNEIRLVKKEEKITDKHDIVETFNTFFATKVTDLKIPTYEDNNFASESFDTTDNLSIDMIVGNYKNHRSIIAIKQICKDDFFFSFQFVERDDKLNKMRSINATRSAQESDIPITSIRENKELFADFLYAAFNEGLISGGFVLFAKWVDATPIIKKVQGSQKDNYRPVSILPNMPKLFERPLFKQLSSFFDKMFLMHQCGF